MAMSPQLKKYKTLYIPRTGDMAMSPRLKKCKTLYIPPNMAINETPKFRKTNQGFHDWANNYQLDVPPNLCKNDPLIFHHIIEDELLERIREDADELGPMKFIYTHT